MMRFKEVLSIVTIFIFLFSVKAFGKTDIFIFGAMNFINSSGSASDYKEGENDFPIKNAHTTNGLGLGVSFPLIKNFFIGFESHYNLGGKAILEDPSDNDTVEIDTYKNSSLFLTLGFEIFKSKSLNLFLNGGAGLNFILEKETKIYTSKFGYETQILPPKSKNNLTGFGGIGLLYRMNDSIGLFLSSRYLYISYEDNPEKGFEILGGLNIGF